MLEKNLFSQREVIITITIIMYNPVTDLQLD